MNKHYSNPVNCVDPEPAFEGPVESKKLNLESLGPITANKNRATVNLTEPEPAHDPKYVVPQGTIFLEELGETTPVVRGKSRFPFIQLEGIDNEAA